MVSNAHERTDTLDELLRAIEAQPRLSADEEAAVGLGAAAGDPAAAQRLVAANLRRVVHVARSFSRAGLPLEDLIHEGALGLLEALTKFDPGRGLRFFTYAVFHVRRRMVAALARGSKTVRVPRHLSARVRRFREERERLSSGLGRRAAPEEVARSLGLGLEEAEATARFQNPYELSVDEPVGEDGGATRGDLLLREEAERGPDALFEAGEDLLELRAALETLRPRDRQVLEARFGLDGSEGRTLRQLGADLSLSKERVRQLEERAKTCLREHLAARRSASPPGPGPRPG